MLHFFFAKSVKSRLPYPYHPSVSYLYGSQSLKPLTDVARNLLAIELRLDVRNDCDGLQQKFQHAKYFI